MANIMELRARGILPYPRTPQPAGTTVSTPLFTAEANPSPGPRSAAPRRVSVPERFMSMEPRQPVVVIDDDPVFDSRTAGRILGFSAERLKKWRQRNQGPDYIQCGMYGEVRYELSALMAYRAAHTVEVGAKP